MSDPRGLKRTKSELEGEARRSFVRALIGDLHAVERMLAEGLFERGVSRIGAEQELFLVDRAYHPAPGALKILEKIDDEHFTTELGLYNLEMNADPQTFAGAGLARMEAQLHQLYGKLRTTAEALDLEPVMVGILPTLEKGDLGLHNMVPKPRYQMLNRAMNAERGEPYDFSIRGLDELVMTHDTVMVESCNASFQAHLQLAEPERFPQMYNLAQALMAPVLAGACNSPLLFGRRLWSETRIALFEQSCDIRSPGLHLRNALGRVSFGRRWLRGSVVDLYKENLARFRALVGSEINEDSIAELDAGRIPQLAALRLHNGTIYRWNRACYDISPSGKPHLRIELRILPSGPTIADEIANTAMWLGLMSELGATIDDVADRLDFDHARANLYNAARDGLAARFTWLEGESVLAQPLILERLLPLAKAGLDRGGVNPADSARYLGIIEKRVRSLHTGSRWMLQSIAEMGDEGTSGTRAAALVAAMITRQKTNDVVADWLPAHIDENDATRSVDHQVSQHMSADLVTARPDDPVRLVQQICAWENLRHLPVEDVGGRLVGLVSLRAIERHLAANPNGGDTSVADLMHTELITVTPDTPTLKAIALARKHKVSCLPVVQGEYIVALLNRSHFVGRWAKVLDQEERVHAKVKEPA